MSRAGGSDEDDGPVQDSIAWFMRSGGDTSEIPPDERADWEAWSSDPAHAAEFRRVQQLWMRLGDPEVRERLAAPGRAEPEKGPAQGWVKPLGRFAVAACVILVVVVFHYTSLLRDSSGDTQIYLTEHSVKILNLSDGSRITLGASTQLSVQYTPTRRLVRLERGEAMFRVAHDRARPFTVLAGTGSITAVGTEFDVRRELDDVDRVVVTVAEGAVEVAGSARKDPNVTQHPAAPETPIWAPARLVKGQEMTYDRTGVPGDTSAVDVEAVAAWVDGRLEYRETPLRLVIPRVSRYSRKSIVLADDSVGDLPFSGIVFTDQIDEWLRALQTAYPVVVREQPDRFLIYARPPGR